MQDFLYVLTAIAFFAVMLAYVGACRRLGAHGAQDAHEERTT